MYSNRLRSVCLSLALVALLGACTKKNEDMAAREVSSQTVNQGNDLPKECLEAAQAQRECTETMAAGYDRVGHPEASKQLRDALPKEMDKVMARWRSVPDKDHLAQSCAQTRDALRAQPQCHR